MEVKGIAGAIEQYNTILYSKFCIMCTVVDSEVKSEAWVVAGQAELCWLCLAGG